MFADPNTGPVKFIPLAAGLAAGAATTSALRHALVEPERAKELADKGIQTIDSRQASVYAMAAPFGVAAGIGMGLQRRASTTGFTTATQVASAALLSTVAGAIINADSDKASDYVTGIAVMAAATGAGVLMGVRDEVKVVPLRMAGLGLFGIAVGAAVPFVIDTVAGFGGRISSSVEHREH